MYPHQILRCQITDHLSQRMVMVDLTVAVGEQEQTVGSADSPAQILDDVEGCLIRPMGVLNNQNRRTEATRQKVQKDLHHRPPVTFLQNFTKRRLSPGDIPERTQRLTSQQIVTRPKVDMGVISMSLDELANQRALADTRLPTEQHHLAACCVKPRNKFVKNLEF